MAGYGVTFQPVKAPFQQRLYEATRQQSARESNSPARSWRKTNAAASAGANMTRELAAIQRQINRLRFHGQVQAEVSTGSSQRQHPFRIYQSPAPTEEWKTANPGIWSDSEAWQWFRVRAGAVGFVCVIGTDGEGDAAHAGYTVDESPCIDPDRFAAPPFDGSAEGFDFKVTKGKSWFVWLDCEDPELPAVGYGEDPPEGVTDDNDGWVGSGRYVLVGIIDCNDTGTGRKESTSVVRQYLRKDVFVYHGCKSDGTLTSIFV